MRSRRRVRGPAEAAAYKRGYGEAIELQRRTAAVGSRRRQIDVTVSRDVGLLSHDDTDQFGYARETGRVLVAFETEFLSWASLSFR